MHTERSESKKHLIRLIQEQSDTPLSEDEALVIVDRLLILYRALIRKSSPHPESEETAPASS